MEKRIVTSTSLFEVDDDFQDSRFMKVRVTALHSGINRNNSKFTKKVIEAAKDTFANIPILAEIKEYTDKDGEKHLDYTTHAMHIEEDAFNEGQDRIIYDETVVGVVPETNNFEMIHDDETGNDYVLVDALLYRDYGNYCCDILEERGGKTDVSAEIYCEDVAFNAKEKCLEVGKMCMNAITLLGHDVKPGMAKAHAETFSLKEDDRNAQLIEIMQELKESLDNYTSAQAENLKEGGKPVKFEELLEKYGKTAEDITFEYEGLSDEELEVAFAEAFADDEGDEGDETEEAPASENPEADPEPTEDENVEEEQGEADQYAVKFTVAHQDNVKEYSVSLSEKIYAMYSLVNETYSELDNDYYDVDVFEEDKIVEMHAWFSNKSYRQSFKVKKDSYQLVGDRVEIFAKYLTQDEITALDNMKANYAVLEDKVAKYESEPAKIELLNSTDYAQIAETEEYKQLMNRDTYFNMSIEEITEKADSLLLQYAKSNKIEPVEKQNFSLQHIVTEKKKQSRYGNLFSKK